jgi:photosystem II stability/assembly factor-like uncharacterized protein
MRNTKPTMITTALAVLVIALFVGTSVSDALQTGVKGKHKHRVKGKHQTAAAQTFAKHEMENERGATAANDSLWFIRHRDPATGTIPDGLTDSWYKSDLAHALARDGHDGIFSTGDPLDTIVNLGPFDQGGRTRAVLVSAADLTNNTFFAGSVSGGLWKTTSAGSTWTPVNDQAANLGVTCITQSPFNSNNIYYGTGEYINNDGPHGNSGGYPGGGVFKSADGGTTFQQLTATASTSQYSWAIECDKADATGNTIYWATVSAGLQRTTDGGTTWSTASGTSGEICDIVTFSNGSVLAAKTDNGLYFAINGKTGNFTKISSTAFPSSMARIKLAQCKGTPNTVYAAFAMDHSWGDGLSALCKSTDGGVHWAAVNTPINMEATQNNYNMMLGIDAMDPNRVICGLETPEYSTDGGTTWNTSLNWGHPDFHGYASFNGSSTQFLLGTDGGVEIHDWSNMLALTVINTNYVTTQFVGGGFAKYGRNAAGGTQDNGNWRISPMDAGLQLLTGDGGYARLSQQDINYGYIADYTGSDIERYTSLFNDQWYHNYQSIGPPAVMISQGLDIYNFYQGDYADEQQLYFRTNAGLWRTINGGASSPTWTQLNTTTIQGIGYIGCTAVSDPSVYFDGHVGTTGHFYRINNAATLTPPVTPVDLSLPGGTTYYMGEISPYPVTPYTTLYIGFTNYGSTYPHAYEVTNASTTPTWINISGNLPPTLGVNQLQADPKNSNTIFAATDYGLYYTTDGGTNWTKEPNVPNTIILEMQLRASDDKLFLFTYGRGVWYCSIAGAHGIGGSVQQASVAPTPTTPQLQFSLYPNPATEKLTVSPQQELSSSARTAIYSSDGRMISESAWNPTGEVNIGLLPSGAYFLQITDGNLIAKNKFIKQ